VKVELSRKGKQVTAINKGNTSVDLVDAEQCSAKNKCDNLRLSKRLYAGNHWTFTAPKALPVKFNQMLGFDVKHVTTN
jgi:hypothetical protein